MTDLPAASADRLSQAYETAAAALLSESNSAGHWTGELSASALSTATAVAALTLFLKAVPAREHELRPLIDAGRDWLIAHQNPDGGWGDTVLSVSNISTAMLSKAALVLCGGMSPAAAGNETVVEHTDRQRLATAIAGADRYIAAQGGVAAVKARYGKDRTFSAPILTQCALAGLADWKEVAALPFELACLPHSFYRLVRLPVVSYALPALIAIGQVRHVQRPSWNPILRGIRSLAVSSSLRKLQAIQPASGGYLEAIPLTSFVTMSLIGCGRADHPVVQKGLEFLTSSVRPDGSWPIDTNLATWVTTLSIHALEDKSVPREQQAYVRRWLLDQQLRTVHPYTQAAPGGWAWTDLTGGVPDADDTPGAILALMKLSRTLGSTAESDGAAALGVNWLLGLQNRDGGWPTFCRGWGALPFDRSSNDITAHVLRALHAWNESRTVTGAGGSEASSAQSESSVASKSNFDRATGAADAVCVEREQIQTAIRRGRAYLERQQRPDGSWLPLWFGNQHVAGDENPLYGTARVLLAYHDLGLTDEPPAQRGLAWLVSQQNDDGGWGGQRGVASTVEETSLAVAALSDHQIKSPQSGLASPQESQNTPPFAVQSARQRGVAWLISRVESNQYRQPSPIGFYFAKLWYFERLYPLVWLVAALRRARECDAPLKAIATAEPQSEPESETLPASTAKPSPVSPIARSVSLTASLRSE